MPPVDLLARLGRPPAVAALDGEDAVYVVGGAVRDLLLELTPHELDFVVEGDAVAVARRAAARIGGDVLVHDRFGTATVTAPEATFDLAGARRERYERPGALPEVELGATLREDLERRDFTVNAIALHLTDGELTWLPRAEEDLRAGRLRVLHDGSFRDDPTRLLRLTRYAARLGFEPEERTDRLAAEAIAAGAVDTVTGSRMGAELRLLLREPQPAALLALVRHGLGSALLDVETDPPWRPPPGNEPPGWPPRAVRFEVRPDIVERAIALCPPDARADLVALAACLVAVLEDAENDVGLWTALRKQPPETVALAGAYSDKAALAARRWLDDVRHRRLAITGDDIVAAGLYGPAVGEALDAAMVAMLRGDADTREEQLAAALG
jgi:tRNA nucleotidyltransferase (CCA-adding enzyme)